MKADGGILLTLAGYFAIMSLFAIGGANGAIPEIYRLVVETRALDDRPAIRRHVRARAGDAGPNVIIVTLIGYHVAGLAGALVTTLAMCGPTAVLAAYLSRTWNRFRHKPWRIVVQAGLVPISVGLVSASAIVLTGVAVHNLAAVCVAASSSRASTSSRVWKSLGETTLR